MLFCLLAVTACSNNAPTSPSPVAREVILAPGQTAPITEASISVKFEGVSGDSRCPADAFCIQGGDALVQIQVMPSTGGSQPYVLHTGDMRPVTHADLTIALVQLTPYPFSSQPIDPSAYRATIRVTR